MDLRIRTQFIRNGRWKVLIYWLMCPCLVAELSGGDGDPVLAARVPRLLQHNSLQRWNIRFKLKRKKCIQIFLKNYIKIQKTLKYYRKLYALFKKLQ